MTLGTHVVTRSIDQKASGTDKLTTHPVFSFGVPAAALLVVSAINSTPTIGATMGANFLTAEIAGGALLGLAAVAGVVSFLNDKKRDFHAMVYLLLSAVLCVWALSWLGLSGVNGAVGLCALPFWFALRRDHARSAAGLVALFAVLWLAAGVMPSLGLAAALLVEWLVCSAVEALLEAKA